MSNKYLRISYVKNKKYYFVSIDREYYFTTVFNSKELCKLLNINPDDYIEESKKYRSKIRGKTIYFDDIEKIKLFIEWIESCLVLNKLSE